MLALPTQYLQLRCISDSTCAVPNLYMDLGVGTRRVNHIPGEVVEEKVSYRKFALRPFIVCTAQTRPASTI
eukprot:5156919-Pyramimonas_sp.AAC.1